MLKTKKKTKSIKEVAAYNNEQRKKETIEGIDRLNQNCNKNPQIKRKLQIPGNIKSRSSSSALSLLSSSRADSSDSYNSLSLSIRP